MKDHIAILIGALALCSCEDYLTQENPNKIESEYYFTDESTLEIYTNGFIRSFATCHVCRYHSCTIECHCPICGAHGLLANDFLFMFCHAIACGGRGFITACSA